MSVFNRLTGYQSSLRSAAGAMRAPLRVATFGDSTANTGWAVCNVAFPASGVDTVGVALAQKLYLAAKPGMQCVFNGGISGETTTQMLARDVAASSSVRRAIRDVIDSAADVVLLRGGSVNDVQALTTASTQADIDAIYNRHVTIIERLRQGGLYVVDEGIFGYSAAVAADVLAVRQAALAQLNARFAAYAAAKPSQLSFLSPVGLLCDASGAYLPGVALADGIHLSSLGGRALGEAEYALLSSIFGAGTLMKTGKPNLMPDPMMQTTGSQSYGTVCTSVSLGSTDSTRQNAKVEAISGGIFQTCEFAATATNPTGSFYLNLPLASMVAGKTYRLGAKVYVSALDGSGPVEAASGCTIGRMQLYKTSSTARIVRDFVTGGGAAAAAWPGPVLFDLVFPDVVMPEAGANMTQANTQMIFNWTAPAGSSFKMGLAYPWMVQID